MTFTDTQKADGIPLTLRCWQSAQPNVMLTHRTADILCDWTECEGHCQITVRMDGSGVSIQAATESPPSDWEAPYKELFSTEWVHIKPETNGEDMIADKLYEIKQERVSASRPIRLRYAGGCWEPLTFREALECLLELRSEGWLFPDSVLGTLADYIQEENLACPKAEKYLESASAVETRFETVVEAMGRQHEAMEKHENLTGHPSRFAHVQS